MFIVNVEAAIYKEGKWLIIERSKKEEHAGGMLSLVGGKVEIENNSVDILERTINREVFEEVGVEINNLIYVHSTSFVTDSNEHVIDIVFLSEFHSGDAYPKCPDEVETVYWMSTNEITSHPLALSYLKDSIQHAESKLTSILSI